MRVESIKDAFNEILKSLRQFDKKKKQPEKTKIKVKVTSGMSVEVKYLEGQVTANQSEPG